MVKKASNNKNTKISKYNRLIDMLKSLNDDEFTGYIRINYSQGAIARVEKFEEILKKEHEKS